MGALGALGFLAFRIGCAGLSKGLFALARSGISRVLGGGCLPALVLARGVCHRVYGGLRANRV